MSVTALGRVFRLIFEDDPNIKSNSIVEQTRLIVINGLRNTEQTTKIDPDILSEF